MRPENGRRLQPVGDVRSPEDVEKVLSFRALQGPAGRPKFFRGRFVALEGLAFQVVHVATTPDRLVLKPVGLASELELGGRLHQSTNGEARRS